MRKDKHLSKSHMHYSFVTTALDSMVKKKFTKIINAKELNLTQIKR